jgi:hypothetical protein
VRQRLSPPFHLAESQIRREPERLHTVTEHRLPPRSSVCCSYYPPGFLGVALALARMTISVFNRNEIEAIWSWAPHFLAAVAKMLQTDLLTKSLQNL